MNVQDCCLVDDQTVAMFRNITAALDHSLLITICTRTFATMNLHPSYNTKYFDACASSSKSSTMSSPSTTSDQLCFIPKLELESATPRARVICSSFRCHSWQSVIKLFNNKPLGTIISRLDCQSLSNLCQHQTNASEKQLKWTATRPWTIQLAPFLSICKWTWSLCQCFLLVHIGGPNHKKTLGLTFFEALTSWTLWWCFDPIFRDKCTCVLGLCYCRWPQLCSATVLELHCNISPLPCCGDSQTPMLPCFGCAFIQVSWSEEMHLFATRLSGRHSVFITIVARIVCLASCVASVRALSWFSHPRPPDRRYHGCTVGVDRDRWNIRTPTRAALVGVLWCVVHGLSIVLSLRFALCSFYTLVFLICTILPKCHHVGPFRIELLSVVISKRNGEQVDIDLDRIVGFNDQEIFVDQVSLRFELCSLAPLLPSFEMIMILVQWTLRKNLTRLSRISPRKTTRPLHVWCFASSTFFKWHVSIDDAQWTYVLDVLVLSITVFLLLILVKFHAWIFSNFSHSFSTAASAARTFTTWRIGTNLWPKLRNCNDFSPFPGHGLHDDKKMRNILPRVFLWIHQLLKHTKILIWSHRNCQPPTSPEFWPFSPASLVPLGALLGWVRTVVPVPRGGCLPSFATNWRYCHADKTSPRQYVTSSFSPCVCHHNGKVIAHTQGRDPCESAAAC